LTKERQKLGREGEELARRFLLSKGYKIVKRNFRTHFGEIDLIAYQKKVLVFIEVRTKTSHNFGAPEESISLNKKKKISRLASFYLKAKRLNEIDCRFDVVCITPHPIPGEALPQVGREKGRGKYSIKLFKDAFQIC